MRQMIAMSPGGVGSYPMTQIAPRPSLFAHFPKISVPFGVWVGNKDVVVKNDPALT